MRIYHVDPEGGDPMFIIARNIDHAAEIYVGWEIANGVRRSSFCVDPKARKRLSRPQRGQLPKALALGVAGIAIYTPGGWSIEEVPD